MFLFIFIYSVTGFIQFLRVIKSSRVLQAPFQGPENLWKSIVFRKGKVLKNPWKQRLWFSSILTIAVHAWLACFWRTNLWLRIQLLLTYPCSVPVLVFLVLPLPSNNIKRSKEEKKSETELSDGHSQKRSKTHKRLNKTLFKSVSRPYFWKLPSCSG